MLRSLFKIKLQRVFYLITLIIALSCSALKAQSFFEKGFLLTNSGDTIHGYIQANSGKTLSRFCSFKTDKHSEIQMFRPSEILGFRFLNSKYYVSKKITTDSLVRLVFLEYLIKGKANVYYLNDSNGDRYFFQKEGEMLEEISEKAKFIKSTNGTYKAPSKYKGKIKSILIDRPDIYQQVDQTTLTHVSLIELAKTYHEKVCTTEDCIIYKRKKPFQVQYGLAAGYTLSNYNFGSQLITNFGSGAQFGLTINIKDFIPSNERFELNFNFLLEKDFRFTLTNHEKNNNENEYVSYQGEDFILNSTPGTLNIKELDVSLNTLGIKFPLIVNYNIDYNNFTLQAGLGVNNKLLLNQNKDFKYQEFFDQYGRSINTYFFGGIGTLGLKYQTKSSKYYTLNLTAEKLTAPRAVNQILRLTTTQFSISVGHSF